MRIRRMMREDIEAVSRLWLAMMREHESRDRHFALASGNPEENFRDYLNEVLEKQDAIVYVAENGGEVIGYILALIFDNPGIFELRQYGFIGEMSVAEEHRRGGVGRQLWERAVGWFRRKGITVIQLNVSPRNETGLAFWDSLGFEDFLRVKWLDLEGEEGN